MVIRSSGRFSCASAGILKCISRAFSDLSSMTYLRFSDPGTVARARPVRDVSVKARGQRVIKLRVRIISGCGNALQPHRTHPGVRAIELEGYVNIQRDTIHRQTACMGCEGALAPSMAPDQRASASSIANRCWRDLRELPGDRARGTIPID